MTSAERQELRHLWAALRQSRTLRRPDAAARGADTRRAWRQEVKDLKGEGEETASLPGLGPTEGGADGDK